MSPRPADPVAPVEQLIALGDLIQGLSAAGALAPGEVAQVLQTHISVVFLTRTRAFKIKKPLRLWGLVDYGTLARRKHWCEEEVRLNRRLAPRVYLGVRAILRTPSGLQVGPADADGLAGADVVEHAVEMRRLSPGSTWKEQLKAGTLDEAQVRLGARRIAAFHAQERLEPQDRGWARPVNFARVLRQNFSGTRAYVPQLFPARAHRGLATRLARRLAGARAALRSRLEAGRMVDGHGDLRLEHVVLQDGELAVIDCVEFTPRLRHIDPFSDLAFLSMDLRMRGRTDLAQALVKEYVDATADPGGLSLLPLFQAYRAHVRAKVDAQTATAGEVSEGVRQEKGLGARRSFATAWSFARAGAPGGLLVLRGLSGSGKSVLAGRIAPWLGAQIVRSDVVRKELLGLGPTDRPAGKDKQTAYSSAVSERTYAEVLARAVDIARRGRCALLDATYLRRESRDEVHAAARQSGLPFAILDVTCDEATVRERLRMRTARGDDASDADWSVYLEQRAEQEPLSGTEREFAVRFPSQQPPESSLPDLIDLLEAQCDARHEPLGPGPEQP